MYRLIALGMVLAAANPSLAAPEPKAATIPDLIRQLSSNDFHVRQHAARQLGNLGLAARDAVPALAKALHDRPNTSPISCNFWMIPKCPSFRRRAGH